MSRDLTLRMIFAAANRASAPMRAVQESASTMGRELKAARDDLRSLERTQKDLDGFRRLKREIGETERALESARRETREAARAIEATENPTREMQRAFERARKSAGELADKHEKQSTELEHLRRTLREADIETNRLGDGQLELKRRMEQASNAVKEQEDRLSALAAQKKRMAAAREQMDATRATGDRMMAGGAQAIGAGAAIGAPVVLATNEAMGFRSSMVDIQQKAELTDAATDRLASNMKTIASASEQLPENIGAGLDRLLGKGMAVDVAQKTIGPAARLATAYKVDVADAADASFASINNLRIEADRTAKILDVMAEAGNRGGFEVRDMARQFPSLTANMAALDERGVPAVANLSAALQVAMHTAGGADEAGNNIKNLLDKINSPATISKFKKNFGVDLPAEMEKFRSKGMSSLEAIAIITDDVLGGDLKKLGFVFEDAQARKGLLAMMQNLDEFREIRDAALSADGTVDVAFDMRMRNDPTAKLQAAKTEAKNLALTVGGALLPAIGWASEKFEAGANAIGAWAQKNPGLAKGLAIVTASLAGLLFLAGGLALMVGMFLGPFAMARYALAGFGPAGLKGAFGVKALGGAFKFVGKAVVGLGKLLLAGGPWMWAIMAIALAAYLIFKHWDKLKPFFVKIWEGVKTAFSAAFTFIKAILFTFTPLGLIFKHWDTIASWFVALWEGVKAAFLWAVDAIGNLLVAFTPIGLIVRHWDVLAPYFAALWGSISESMRIAWEAIAGFFAGLWSGIQERFAQAWSIIKRAAEGEFNPGNLIIAHWRSIVGWFAQLWASVAGAFSNGWNAIRNRMAGWAATTLAIGRDIVAGLARGIAAAPEAVFNALRNVVFGSVRKVKDWLGIKSPSRVFAGIGLNTMDGLKVGIDRGGGEATERLRGIVRNMRKVGAGLALSASVPLSASALSPTAPPDLPSIPKVDPITIEFGEMPELEPVVVSFADLPQIVPASLRGLGAGQGEGLREGGDLRLNDRLRSLPRPRSAAARGDVTNVTVNLRDVATNNAAELERRVRAAVKQALEEARREKAAARRSRYEDEEDA